MSSIYLSARSAWVSLDLRSNRMFTCGIHPALPIFIFGPPKGHIIKPKIIKGPIVVAVDTCTAEKRVADLALGDAEAEAESSSMAVAVRSVSVVLKRFISVRASNRIWRNKGFMCKMSTESPSLSHSITLPNKQSEPVRIVAAPGVSHSDFWRAVDSSLFKQWLHNLQSETGILADGTMTLRQVLIQGVDMFGEHIGFLKFKADIFDIETGKKVPGIVFARGPAVAVLILLESDGETYAVLTEQARVPVGRIILELPAGMLDHDKGDFVGTAVREVEEETGIKLNVEDVVDLTAFLDSSTGCRVFPSGGGCDEEISIFLYRGRVDKEIITQLQGKETGLREHGELIKVRVVPYKKLWRTTADAKVLVAVALFEMATKEGWLPPLAA